MFNIGLICSLVIIPAVFGYLKMPKEMGLSILAIAIALSFNNLEKFSKFKGAGFEAELNTAVNKNLNTDFILCSLRLVYYEL